MSSATTATTAKPASRALGDTRYRDCHFETYRCANESCDAAIPGDCVVNKIDDRAGTRSTRIYCEKCGRGFEAAYRLIGGMWQLDGQVKPITAPKQLAGLKARVDYLRGEMQIGQD